MTRNSGGGPSSPYYNPSQPSSPPVRPVVNNPHAPPMPQPRTPLPVPPQTAPRRPAGPAMPGRGPDPHVRPIRP